MGAIEMAQLIKVLATKPNDPSSIPGACVVKGESQVLQVVL